MARWGLETLNNFDTCQAFPFAMKIIMFPGDQRRIKPKAMPRKPKYQQCVGIDVWSTDRCKTPDIYTVHVYMFSHASSLRFQLPPSHAWPGNNKSRSLPLCFALVTVSALVHTFSDPWIGFNREEAMDKWYTCIHLSLDVTCISMRIMSPSPPHTWLFCKRWYAPLDGPQSPRQLRFWRPRV